MVQIVVNIRFVLKHSTADFTFAMIVVTAISVTEPKCASTASSKIFSMLLNVMVKTSPGVLTIFILTWL